MDRCRNICRCVVGLRNGVAGRVVEADLAAGEAVVAGCATVAVAVDLVAVAAVVAMVINCALNVVCCFALRRLVLQ